MRHNMAETANTKEDISVSPKEATEGESAEMWQQLQHSLASYQNAPPHYGYHQPQHHQHQQQPPSYAHHQHYQRQHEGYQSQETQPPHVNHHASYDHHPSYNERPNPPPHHSPTYHQDTNQEQQHYYHQHQEDQPPQHPSTHVNEMLQASYHCEPAGRRQTPSPQVSSVASSHRAISSSWSEASSMSHSSSNPSYAHAACRRDRGSPSTIEKKYYPQQRPAHHDQTSAHYEGRRDRHISEDGRMEWNGSEWVPRRTRHHHQQHPPPPRQQYYAEYETSLPPSESFSSVERKRVTMSHENRNRALPPVFQPPAEDQQQHSAEVHSKMKPEDNLSTKREVQFRNTRHDTTKKQRDESENHRPSVVIIDDDDNGQKLSERKETVSTSPKISSVSPSSSSSRRNENTSTAPKHQLQSNQLHHQRMDEEKESHSDAKSPIVMEYLVRAKERESEKRSGLSDQKQRQEPTPQYLSEKKHEEPKGIQAEVTTTDRSEKKQQSQLPPPSSILAGVVGSLKKHETSTLSSAKARMADSHRTKRLLMSFFSYGSSSMKENHTQPMKAAKRTRLVSEPSSPETVGPTTIEEKQRYVLKFNTQRKTYEKKNTYNKIEEHSTRPTSSSSRGRFLNNQIQDSNTSDKGAWLKKQTSAYIYSYNTNVQKSDPFFSSCSEVKHLSHPSPIADMTLTLAKKGSDGNDCESNEGATGSATELSTSGAVSEESSTASELLSSSSDYSEESVVEYKSKNKTKKRKRIIQPRSSRQQQTPPTNQTSVPRLQPAPPVLEGREVNSSASRQKQDKHKRPKMRHRRQVSPTQPLNKLIGDTSKSLIEVERKNKSIGGAKLGNVRVSNEKKSETIQESSAVHANAAAEKKSPVDKAVPENRTASDHQASSSSTPLGELRNKKPTKPVMLAPPKKSSKSKSKVTQRKRKLPTRENWSEHRLPHTLQGTDVCGEVHAGASKSGSSRFSAKDMSTSSSLSIEDTSSKCLSVTDDPIARLKNSYDANEPKVAMKSLERSASAESHPLGPKRSSEPKVQDNRRKKRRSSSIEITPDAYGGNKKLNKEDGGPPDKKKNDGNRLAPGRETDKLPHQPKKISLEEATVPNKKQRPINEKKNVVTSEAFKATKTPAEEVEGNDAVIPSSLQQTREKSSKTSSTSKTEDKQKAISCTSDRKKKQDSFVKVPCTEINWSDMGKEDDIVDDNAINDTPQWKDWNTDNPICKEVKDKEGRKAHAQRKRVTEYECEVCRKQTFLDFDECVAHEEKCLAEQQKSGKSARKKSTEHKDKSVVKSNDVLQEVKSEDLVSLLMQQLVHCGKNNKGSAGMAGNTMMCKHCKNAKFPKTSSTKRLGKWKRKRKVVNHLLNCPNGADETKHTIEKIWEQEVASREKSLGSLDLQAKAPSATPVASALKSDRKEPPIEETKPADNRVLNNATFVRSESGGWSCRQCRMLPLSLRAEGAVLHGLPSESCVENHLKICCRNRPVLGAAKDAILGMTDTISKMRFDTLIEPDFKAIVRILVGGIEDLVTTFTDAIRAEWFGSDAESFKIPGDESWEKFPAETIDEEAAIDAMATFARSGIGFDFVSNESFVRYVDIIAPGYKLPTEDDLMACW